MKKPRCFISYSWDPPENKDWVRRLAEDLQQQGVHVHLDEWDIELGMDVTGYMERSIRESDFVLLICTEQFAVKANAGKGGVGYEKAIVTGEIFSGQREVKFVPVLRSGSAKTSLPSYLKPKVYVDFRNDDEYDSCLEKLLRHLHDDPRYTRPPLGGKPVWNEQTAAEHPIGEAKIVITLGEKLLNTSFRFGLLHVRDGKDQVPDHGPLLNKEIYFEEINDRGTLVATVLHNPVLGFQFKCFVDHRGQSFDWVRQALESDGYREASKGGGRNFRAWFLVEEYDVCTTIDDIHNNFFYPA